MALYTFITTRTKWTLTGYVENMTNYALKTSWTSMGAGGMLMIDSPITYGGILSGRF